MRHLASILTVLVGFNFGLREASAFHSIHISYSQAELKGNDLFVKVSYYKDDFTKAVKNWYGGKAASLSAPDFQNAEIEYLKNFFRVWSNRSYKSQVMPDVLKVTDDGTSIIFELKFSSSLFNSIIIDQRVLFKEFSDQSNIFFIKAFSKEGNHIFTPSQPTFAIN